MVCGFGSAGVWSLLGLLCDPPAGVSGLGSGAGAGIRQCLLLSRTASLPKRRSPSLKEHPVSPCLPCFPCLTRRRQPRRHQRSPPRPPFPSCQSLVSTTGAPPVFPGHKSSLGISVPRVLCLPSCPFVLLSLLGSLSSLSPFLPSGLGVSGVQDLGWGI